MSDQGSRVAARRRRWEWIILLSMYLGYAGLMLCRNTLIVASPAMIQDQALGLDEERYGRLMSAHSAGAIAGKLVSGVGADLLGGRRTFLLVIALTAGCNLAFGLFSLFTVFVVLNFLGQFFKAGGWPAMAKIIGDWYPPREYGQVWSLISTSSRVGTVSAGLFLGYLLTLMPWRGVFLVSGVVTLGAFAFCHRYLRSAPADVGLPPPPLEEEDEEEALEEEVAAEEPPPHPLDGTDLKQACWVFLWSARVWLICASLAFLTIMMDFINFVPLYLQATLEVGPGRASMAGSALPAGHFAALLMASALYDRLGKRRLVPVLGAMLVGTVLCVLALGALPHLGLSKDAGVWSAVGLIFVFGLFTAPAYYLPMSIFAIEFGGPHSGFLVAMIDVFGYTGAMVFNFFGGSIAKHYGWPVFLKVLLTVSVIALAVTVAFLVLDARAAVRDEAPTA